MKLTSEGKASILNKYANLGDFYLEYGNDQLAEEKFLKGLEIDEALDYEEGKARHYASLGEIYAKRADVRQAEKMYLSGLKIAEALENQESMARYYAHLGVFYVNQGDDEHRPSGRRKQNGFSRLPPNRAVGESLKYRGFEKEEYRGSDQAENRPPDTPDRCPGPSHPPAFPDDDQGCPGDEDCREEAARAPGIPAVCRPTKVATFRARGPGVI